MELDKAIIQLYQDTIFGPSGNVQLRDDGNGPYIAQWNRPEPQPTPQQLEAAWQAWLAGQPARDARALELAEAHPIAKAFYDANPAVKAFIRDKTPAERKAEINAMTLAQLRTVMWYMVEAVLCDIKERFLD